jgi:glycosyltransferase involved in cell wall biosynthesis
VDDVEKLMKSSDIFLNFSESESFSLTCLEALVYGVPLIASDSGGPGELFEHEQSGLLVPNRDLSAMTAAIVRLSKDQKLRERFALEGRQYVTKKFGIEKSASALTNVYTQISQ